MIPLEMLSEAGEIEPEKGIEITSRLITTFFDKHLKNKDVDVDLLNSEYELLNLKIYKGELVNN